MASNEENASTSSDSNIQSAFDVEKCVICRADSVHDELTLLGPKGVQGVQDCSVLRSDTELTDYLLSKPASVQAHVDCFFGKPGNGNL